MASHLDTPHNGGAPRSGFGQQVERSVRLSDKVADAMLDTILNRGLRPGDPLPSERELGEQYGVSRTVIREAVRALTSRGVIDARAGRGLTVAKVAPETVSASMQLYLHGQDQIPYAKIHEVRTGIEIQIAGYAAERATDEEIEELSQLNEALNQADESDHEQLSILDVEFHRAIARMTHNELYLIMLDSIGPLMLEVRRATIGAPNGRAVAYDIHKKIVDAIASRDPDKARDAMQEHLAGAVLEWKELGNVKIEKTRPK
jgi:GntR family transcriptional repressor for pyruvate dehydrogenase complex